MLEDFVVWAQTISKKKFDHGISANVTKNVESLNSSARLDVDTPNYIARITFWISGDFHAEILHVDSERTVFSKLGTMDVNRFDPAIFDEFFSLLLTPSN